MIEPITRESLESISNTGLREYAETYLVIAEEFEQQVEEYGLPFSCANGSGVFDGRIDDLEARGLIVSNDRKSFHLNWISPSCITCRKGLNTATFLLSVQCPRSCFFCFNPNQENYEGSKDRVNDVVAELEAYRSQGAFFVDLALTGGEPLLHKEETRAFFEHARRLYPESYTRLYTSGYALDEAYLKILCAAGLDEIRFSIKTEDDNALQQEVLGLIALSKRSIPAVVVEMPVMPDNLEQMKTLLLELDSIGIAGINLLELCFPFNNAAEFARRGYRIKQRPFRVLYDYWYAGGLPIAGSEEACLELLAFAIDKGLGMGVHYCSLENKFSGQIYLQDYPHRSSFPPTTLSDKDYFLKSAKVFGEDRAPVKALFDDEGLGNYRFDEDNGYLEFPCSYLAILAGDCPDLEVGIAYYVVEQHDGETVLRELRLDLCHPISFDIGKDL